MADPAHRAAESRAPGVAVGSTASSLGSAGALRELAGALSDWSDEPSPWPWRGDSELLASAVRLTAGLLQARRCSLMVLDAASGGLVIRQAIGLPADALREPIAWRTPVAGRVAQTGVPLLVADIRQHPELGRPRGRGYRTPSFASVPVVDAQAVLGVVNVADRTDGEPFTATDLDRLADVARHLAACLRATDHDEEEIPLAVRRAIGRRLVAAREAERARIGRELHDEAGQALAAATFRLDLATEQLGQVDVRARALLGEARRALLECGAQLHRVALNLRPRLLDDLGLVPAVREYLSQFAGRSPSLGLTVLGEERRLPPGLELCAFRVVQEAVTNVLRHAGAAEGTIVLVFEPRWLRVVVRDDGVGFDPLDASAWAAERGRLGLPGMMERVRQHDGELTITSAPGRGTSVECRLPARSMD